MVVLFLAMGGGWLHSSVTRAADGGPGNDCCAYTVNGTVWYDQNANGIKEIIEPPLPGWTVKALDVSNNVVATTTTNALGQYQFVVPVGCGYTFKTQQVVQSGWTQTFPPANGLHTGFGTGCGNSYGPYDFGNTQPDCAPFTKTYTLDADFNLGTLNGVVTNSDQLELATTPTTWPYAWVANSGEGTLSKIDTQTGRELARYYTGPPDMSNMQGPYVYLSPSRTVVDKDGNCWVSNRNYGSLYASTTEVLGSGGVDFNGNSVINTSWDANNNGVIDPSEILPWGQDERVVRHYRMGGISSSARATVIDKMGFLWVGHSGTGATVVQKFDPNLPIATYGSNMPPSAPIPLVTITFPYPIDFALPYGMALSPNGKLYMSLVSNKALEIDPGIASGGTGAGPAITEYINHGGTNYGITVDRNCIVWIAMMSSPGPGGYGCVRWDPPLTAGNPLMGWTYSAAGAPGVGRGICVDFNNDIWMACDDANNSAVKYTNTVTPTVIGVYPTPSQVPVGVGPASDGNIIVTPSGNSLWTKLDVSTGAQIPLAWPQLVGYFPYTYSDFTGSNQAINGTQQGTWTVITDGGSSQLAWNFIGWNSLLPPSTAIVIEARVAQTIPALATKPWVLIGAPGPLGTPMHGRYIETRARLQRFIEGCSAPFVTPVLYDLTVSAICDPCVFATCPADTVVPCMSPQGAEVMYTPPILKASCDSTYAIVGCTPPPGFFPMGTTPVTCIAVNAENDTVKCTFNVTVNGDCNPPPTGACCVKGFCSVTTQASCEMQGGLYFGDNTTCVNGCNRNCATPPNNLVAWWPLNGSTSGVTPNLASPLTGGTLVNSPTATLGQKVVNCYTFNGVNQYINVGHHSTLNLGASNFTIDAWVKTDQAQGVTTILDKRDPNVVQGIAFFLFNGYPALQMAVGNVWSNFILNGSNGGPAAFVADGQWHLVAVTVERGNPAGGRFYVDGSAVGTPFNPVPRAGNLNNTEPIYIARRHPGLGDGYFRGSLDEIEITRRALGSDEILALWTAGAAGKCPETCYASQSVPCCNGLNSNSAITICNYSLSPHVYSWGLTPLNGGPGCGAFGPTSFVPASGTVTVPAQGCVTIPVQIACPSNIPPGQLACYDVSIFNHDTGSLFGCKGSVRRTTKWCWKGHELDVVGIIDIGPGTPHTLQFQVENQGEPGTPGQVNYMIRALAGDTGLPSEAVSLNGLPPGEPVLGIVDPPTGGSSLVSFDVTYPEGYLIGYDRLAVYADEDGDGTDEPVAELAVRSVVPGLSGVPGEPGSTPTPGAGSDGFEQRLFLAFPNPFGASDVIRFRVDGDRTEEVKLRLYDLMGRTVKVFYYENLLPPGEYTVSWDTKDSRGEKLRPGIYFLKLDVGSRKEAVKVMVR